MKKSDFPLSLETLASIFCGLLVDEPTAAPSTMGTNPFCIRIRIRNILTRYSWNPNIYERTFREIYIELIILQLEMRLQKRLWDQCFAGGGSNSGLSIAQCLRSLVHTAWRTKGNGSDSFIWLDMCVCVRFNNAYLNIYFKARVLRKREREIGHITKSHMYI